MKYYAEEDEHIDETNPIQGAEVANHLNETV